MARPGGTLVDVYFAAVALEARHTETTVLVSPVQADGPILARARGTLAHILLAVGTAVARLAPAAVLPSTLHAGAVVAAGLAGAKGRPRLAAAPARALAAIPTRQLHTLQVRLQARAALAHLAFAAAGETCQAGLTMAGVVQVSRSPAADPLR